MRALIVGTLVLSAASFALADDPADVSKKLKVSSRAADRLFQALSQESEGGEKHDGIEIQLRWKVTGKEKTADHWFIHGQLSGTSKVTKHTSKLGWVASILSPSNQSVDFKYDKAVLVEYRGSSQELAVTMQEGAEVTGKYNVMVSATADMKVNASVTPTLNVSSPNFGVSAGLDKKNYSVGVTGLPYVLQPELSVDTWGEGHLRVKMGVLWQSQCDLSAIAVQGTTNQVSFDLSYSGASVVKGDVGVSNTTFKSSLKVSAVGNGIIGRLIYDDTETDLAYKMSFAADASWFMQVTDFPVTQLGSAHFEETKQVKPSAKLPVVEDGLPSGPATSSAAPASLMEARVAAPSVAPKLGSLYMQPDAKPATPTKGLVGKLDEDDKPEHAR